jgi:alkanesulfonate monooxygenase SsuD/methylene tetrahydromethanopterin reductase-like flavin-dependent oxidoreductase (luciferase family)
MRFALMSEPQQGLSYDEIFALADTAEDAGIEAFFRSDHYGSFPGEAGLATTDAWATLAGLGRDADQLVYSAMVGVLVAETQAELEDRVRELLAAAGGDGDPQAWLAERRARWILGTPDQAWDRVRALEEAGVQRLMLQDFLPRDLDMVRLIGRVFSEGSAPN